MSNNQDNLMVFSSDNAVGASPQIAQAVVEAAASPAPPYGDDTVTDQLRTRLRDTFECDLDVFPTSTGTAANGLALATVAPAWQSVICHENAHINTDEAGAPEFFTGGGKLLPLPGEAGKINAGDVAQTLGRLSGNVHAAPPAAVTLTQATEMGTVYSVEEIHEISEAVHRAGLYLHMDGARFANALVATGASAADMTWRAGVDLLSFGATKNGALTADAVICFNPALKVELAHRHKRAGQLSSKMVFQSAQLLTYLENGLWLENARQANAMADRLRAGLGRIDGAQLLTEGQANIVFAELPPQVERSLRAAGYSFYGESTVRLVTSFKHQPEDIDAFLAAAATQ